MTKRQEIEMIYYQFNIQKCIADTKDTEFCQRQLLEDVKSSFNQLFKRLDS